tara:strand:+ start:101 stop:571 length:471 start_codon:yes stop_codon:yes gene_type:complete
VSRLAEKYGHRGACLLGLGTVWVMFGISVPIEPQEPRPYVLHEMLPVELRAALWIGTGLLGCWYGMRGQEHDDTVGMVALVALPVERLVSFAVSWVAHAATTAASYIWPSIEVSGYDRGWYAASVWALIVVLLRIIAGWPNPRRVLNFPTEGDRRA